MYTDAISPPSVGTYAEIKCSPILMVSIKLYKNWSLLKVTKTVCDALWNQQTQNLSFCCPPSIFHTINDSKSLQQVPWSQPIRLTYWKFFSDFKQRSMPNATTVWLVWSHVCFLFFPIWIVYTCVNLVQNNEYLFRAADTGGLVL